jgi:DNA-binding protein WhiA
VKDKTFTQLIKEELMHNSYDLEHQQAILAGFLKCNSSLVFKASKRLVEIVVFNDTVATYILSLLEALSFPVFEISEVTYSRSFVTSSRLIYVDDEATKIIEKLSIDIFDEIFLTYREVPNMTGGLLAGFFLAGGSCSDPTKTSYHLELSFKNKELASDCKKYINKYYPSLMNFKYVARRSSHLLYLKKEPEIVNFIVAIGAQDCGLEYERIRIEKEDNNFYNRQAICDRTNLERSLKNAATQLEAINYLQRLGSIERFSNKTMVFVMKLRLEHPESNLRELSEAAVSLGKHISKTTISRMLALVHKEYLRLREKHGKQIIV